MIRLDPCLYEGRCPPSAQGQALIFLQIDNLKIKAYIELMPEEKRNGFLPGWPPFIEFKREMQGLLIDTLEEHNRPIKQDIGVLKESILNLKESALNLKESVLDLTKGQKDIQNHLNNHVTDTDKKINQVNAKLDKLLEK